jgi:hypothetical protein
MDYILAQLNSDLTKRNLVLFFFQIHFNVVVLYGYLTISSFDFLFVRVFQFLFVTSVIQKTHIGAAVIL